MEPSEKDAIMDLWRQSKALNFSINEIIIFIHCMFGFNFTTLTEPIFTTEEPNLTPNTTTTQTQTTPTTQVNQTLSTSNITVPTSTTISTTPPMPKYQFGIILAYNYVLLYDKYCIFEFEGFDEVVILYLIRSPEEY